MPDPHAPSASVTEAAATLSVEPPTEEEIARMQGAQVVLPDDSAAAAGARGVYPDHAKNTLLRDAGYVQMGLDPNDPSGELTDPDAPPAGETGGAPANEQVPFVSQAGSELSCTMGIWVGEPTSYAYAWQMDGAPVGSDASTYAVQAGDVGHTATCVVTATNAAGSTAAPPSNSVVVA